MKYKHIIWDWNGTLLNDRWVCVNGINNCLKKRGLSSISEETYKSIFTFPVKDYYKKLGFDFKEEPFEVAGDEFVEFYGEQFHLAKLHLGCRKVLEKISILGITQSILSAGKHEFLIEWVRSHDLQKYFIKIFGINNQYATGKTKLGTYLISQLPYKNDEVVMVGDTIHDSDVAASMNVDCLLVDHGHVSFDRLQKTGRTILTDLNQIFDYIS